MSSNRFSDGSISPMVKGLAGLLVTIFFVWVSSLQASNLRLIDSDIEIRAQLANKGELIAANISLLQQLVPQLNRVENKLDKILEQQSTISRSYER